MKRHGMIDWFADRMQAKIEARGYHGKLPQLHVTSEQWLQRLVMELGELAEALLVGGDAAPDKEAIIDECADVANFAMQIADKAARERNKAQP